MGLLGRFKSTFFLVVILWGDGDNLRILSLLLGGLFCNVSLFQSNKIMKLLVAGYLMIDLEN